MVILEEILYGDLAVREAAVIGIRMTCTARRLARPSHQGRRTATPAELRDYVKRQVAAYYYPRRVWFVEELPKSPTGRIIKREIGRPRGLRSPMPLTRRRPDARADSGPIRADDRSDTSGLTRWP
jgi:long-chain acyl-CoA synthetase